MGMKQYKVQGSQEEPYTVTFHRHGDHVRASCTCTAGEYGQYCKHRLILIEQHEDLRDYIAGSDLESVILEVKEAHAVVDQATRNLKSLKRKMARIMSSQ